MPLFLFLKILLVVLRVVALQESILCGRRNRILLVSQHHLLAELVVELAARRVLHSDFFCGYPCCARSCVDLSCHWVAAAAAMATFMLSQVGLQRLGVFYSCRLCVKIVREVVLLAMRGSLSKETGNDWIRRKFQNYALYSMMIPRNAISRKVLRSDGHYE